MGENPLSYTETGLRDVLNNDLESKEDAPAEVSGFFIQPHGGGKYRVQYDGHVGSVMEFHRDEYDDVLELVDDIIGLVITVGDYHDRGDTEGLVEWAGKMITSDKDKAAKSDLYIYVA